MKPMTKRPTDLQLMIGWSLEMVLDASHELYRLAGVIDWGALEAEFGKLYCPDNGRPGIPIRLMAGLHFLKHAFGVSDEEVVRKWKENPYWQSPPDAQSMDCAPARNARGIGASHR